ncbi:hypothetical protein G7066_03175 [Leucobacter coleopterorum]|uniref:Uncharacterized protein n=1 Tax=Leucobacter coleopterorum TaxID=2714933 RepID=A0ABX6JUG9_9MICO|nr:hypothetical protein [Leucobacter coleopterorum]QIM17931.1 hypothetical protein G7066_03175 [Leucobacter coleopterorum]
MRGTEWINVTTAAAASTYIQYTYTAGSPSSTNHLPSGTSEFRIVDTTGVVLWDDIQLSRVGNNVTATSGVG